MIHVSTAITVNDLMKTLEGAAKGRLAIPASSFLVGAHLGCFRHHSPLPFAAIANVLSSMTNRHRSQIPGLTHPPDVMGSDCFASSSEDSPKDFGFYTQSRLHPEFIESPSSFLQADFIEITRKRLCDARQVH
jgi:hypothetical protein